ncbi:MAG: N(4)-(beta-N-acetylglucosaminyl)-L-asparaginase [Planctomycetota bacterium]|jgi:L-asparaginase/N4-(beta-N-acetylglucosaminyl)-L-asparaginase
MTRGPTRREFLIGAAAAGIAAALPKASPLNAKEKPVALVVSTWKHGLAANEAAWKTLSRGGSPLDAVESAVKVSEADPEISSVGYGGRPNAEGVVELDAAVMLGADRNAGGAAALRGIRHPVSVARRVMEKTRHVMLVGDGALRFALAEGFEEEDLLTEDSRAAWEKWKRKSRGEAEGKDTIGTLAVDGKGRLAAACTTSGLAYKRPGRVGDSPIVGCGLYADDTAGCAAGTGLGEEIIKVCGSFLVVEEMRRGASPQEACEAAIARILEGRPENRKIQAAFIALSPRREVGAASIRPGFQFAVRDAEGARLFDAKALVE